MASKSLDILINARDNASKTLKGVSGTIKKFESQIRTAGIGMTVAGGVIAGGLSKSIQIASDAEEIGSKFNTVYKGMEDDMNGWANNFSKNVGRANQDIKKYAGNLGDLLKPIGYSTEEAAKMSQSMIELALDVASFNNAVDADVIKDFGAAMTGEYEPLKKYGIVINETVLKQKALEMGLSDGKTQLDAQTKALVTQKIMLESSKDAQGDLARTSDSFANTQKRLKAQITDLSETIGKQLLPVVTPLITKISEVATKVANWASQNPELTRKIILITGAVGGLMLVLGPLLIMLPGIVSAVGILGTAFTVLTGPVGAVIAIIGILIATGVLLYKNWDTIKWAADQLVKKLSFAWTVIKDGFKSAFQTMGTIFSSVWEGIKSTIKGAINWYIDKINWVIGKANSIAASISNVPGVTIRTISEIPRLAKGGIVTKPTLAMIGESGPEAVVPLSNNKKMGATFNFDFRGSVLLDENVVEQIGDTIMRQLKFSNNL